MVSALDHDHDQGVAMHECDHAENAFDKDDHTGERDARSKAGRDCGEHHRPHTAL